MGEFEAGAFVEPDLSGVGNPVNACRRVIVEQHDALQSVSARELERSGAQHDENDTTGNHNVPRCRGNARPPCSDVEVGIFVVVSTSPTSEGECERSSRLAECLDDVVGTNLNTHGRNMDRGLWRVGALAPPATLRRRW